VRLGRLGGVLSAQRHHQSDVYWVMSLNSNNNVLKTVKKSMQRDRDKDRQQEYSPQSLDRSMEMNDADTLFPSTVSRI
jgi:hypothetical protein